MDAEQIYIQNDNTRQILAQNCFLTIIIPPIIAGPTIAAIAHCGVFYFVFKRPGTGPLDLFKRATFQTINNK